VRRENEIQKPLKFVIKKHGRWGRVLFVDGDQAFVAKGNRLFLYKEGHKEKMIASLSVSFLEKMLSLFTFMRLGMRLGIHAAQPLNDGRILIVQKKRFVLIEADGSSSLVDQVHRGNKPASRAVCRVPDGSVLYGEYLLNDKRQSPVAVYSTENPAAGFKKIFEFSPGVVRHIHFIQWDPFDECLWMGTGDADHECDLFRSTDQGKNWLKIGGGSQLWRAVSVVFSQQALYWGTDAGSDAGHASNHIVRFDRGSKELKLVKQIQGPCHGSGILHDGTMFFSTGVEGGINEIDTSAHLWASRDGLNWYEVFHLKKKKWPHIIQYGVMRIPPGTETSDKLHFTSLALQGASERWFSVIPEDEA
jgi:hypothetical protein